VCVLSVCVLCVLCVCLVGATLVMSESAYPKIVAFDLDDTIWSPEMWLCSGPPFSKDKSVTSALIFVFSQTVVFFA